VRIGLVLGPEDHIPSRRKLESARRIAASTGIDLPVERIAHSHYNLEAGQAATARLLALGVTAVICASDPLALGAVRAVRRAGLTVPGDVSVVGFDDSALMNSIDPPLTTVRQPIEPMGRMVIEMLVAQLAGTAVAAEEYLFEPELVVRGSTARVVGA
jgi:DNA-binding LacI/PurR family transcriptional regulator